jgi:nitroimidazol reductase NimA-like FMN-containing flavoprotein (pyridoxamine 5'-phosphate oxidase superfamily)
MLRDLTAAEVEEVLRETRIGRIGCHAEGRIYVVPIVYLYEDGCAYGRSADGLKIRTMRANPSVCFEVELAHGREWRSVIAWGTYEELSGSEEDDAAARFAARFPRLPVEDQELTQAERNIFFRLRLGEKTGRFEVL